VNKGTFYVSIGQRIPSASPMLSPLLDGHMDTMHGHTTVEEVVRKTHVVIRYLQE